MDIRKGKTDCKPADVDFDENRLETLNNHFTKLVEDNEIYGAAYCLSRRGKVFAHGGIGYKSYEKDAKQLFAPTDIQFIASMTKTFAGVAITKLVEDGITRLDVSVGEILQQFSAPPFNGITLFHLLTHTSGMHPDGGCFPNAHNHGGYWDFIKNGYLAHKADKSKTKEPFDWISAALAHGVRLEPGKQWMYCSFGFSILGEVITKLTNMRADEYIIKNILKPLGMKDTMFDLTPEASARFFIHDEYTKNLVNDLQKGTLKEDEDDKFWKSIPRLGGGMKSTVKDIVKYGNMVLYNGTFGGVRIIGRKAVEKMTDFAVQLPDYCWGANGTPRGYGVGFDHRNGAQFSFSKETVMHEGAGACALYIDPKEELVAAWFAPFVDRANWCTRAMYSTVNVIWSGLK